MLMSHVSNSMCWCLQDACARSDDLLAGLCAVAQQWLRNVVLLNACNTACIQLHINVLCWCPQDACAGSDDLLPGLCALAQQWLRDVALPGFRAMPQQTVSLTDWYNNRGVSLYLQVGLLLYCLITLYYQS